MNTMKIARILLPADLSEPAHHAFAYARLFAEKLRAHVDVVYAELALSPLSFFDDGASTLALPSAEDIKSVEVHGLVCRLTIPECFVGPPAQRVEHGQKVEYFLGDGAGRTGAGQPAAAAASMAREKDQGNGRLCLGGAGAQEDREVRRSHAAPSGVGRYL